jgi:signal transduction histidine kinase
MPGIGSAVVASVERAPWGWVLTLAVITAIIKGWPAIQDAATRAKTALGDRRMSRIEKLEAKLEEQRASFEAEISILRHDLRNAETCLDLLLTLLETSPEKAAAHALRIKDLMEKRAAAQVQEKAAIRAARIISAGQAGAAVKEAGDDPQKPV